MPRTPEEAAGLIASRPAAWEYLLYAGFLLQGKQRLEPKWRDHRLGLALPGGVPLSDLESIDALKSVTRGPLMAVQNFDRVMSQDAQEDAFGVPGEPGDPEAIDHLARRFLDIYEYLLDWAADIRSLGVADELADLRTISAKLSDRAIEQIREFIDLFAAEMEQVPERLARGDEGIRIEMTLKLDVGDDLIDAHAAEWSRLEAEWGGQ